MSAPAGSTTRTVPSRPHSPGQAHPSTTNAPVTTGDESRGDPVSVRHLLAQLHTAFVDLDRRARGQSAADAARLQQAETEALHAKAAVWEAQSTIQRLQAEVTRLTAHLDETSRALTQATADTERLTQQSRQCAQDLARLQADYHHLRMERNRIVCEREQEVHSRLKSLQEQSQLEIEKARLEERAVAAGEIGRLRMDLAAFEQRHRRRSDRHRDAASAPSAVAHPRLFPDEESLTGGSP